MDERTDQTPSDESLVRIVDEALEGRDEAEREPGPFEALCAELAASAPQANAGYRLDLESRLAQMLRAQSRGGRAEAPGAGRWRLWRHKMGPTVSSLPVVHEASHGPVVVVDEAAGQPRVAGTHRDRAAVVRSRWAFLRGIRRPLTAVAALLLMALILVGFGRLAAELRSASATATPAAIGAESDRLMLVSSLEAPDGSGPTGRLVIFDRATGRETPARTIGGSPDAALSPDGGKIYVAATEPPASSDGQYRDNLSAIDLESGTQLWQTELQNRVLYHDAAPTGLVLSADGQSIYVYSYDPKRQSDGAIEYWLQRADARTGKLDPRKISLGDCGAATFQVAPPTILVAACSELSQLKFVDLANGKVDTLDVRGAGWLAGAALSADRRLVYAVTTTWQLDVVDVASRAIVRTVALDQADSSGGVPDAVALTRDGSRLVVSLGPPGSPSTPPATPPHEVWAYDTETWQRTIRVQPNIPPYFQLMPGKGHFVYGWDSTVALAGQPADSTVFEIDLDQGTVRLVYSAPGVTLARVLATTSPEPPSPAPTPIMTPTPSSSATPAPTATPVVPTPTPAQAPAVQTPIWPSDKPTPVPLVNPLGPRESRTVKASLPSLPGAKSITAAAFLDASHGWLARGGEVSSSVDGGRTWARRSTLPAKVHSLDFVSASAGWAATDSGLYATTDGGDTWRSVALPHWQGPVVRVDFVDATHGWVAPQPPEALGHQPLLRTADGGRTWITLTTPCDTRFDWAAFSFVSSSSGWLVCGGEPSAGSQEKYLYRTDDAGSQWRLVSKSEYSGMDAAVPKSLPGGGYVADLYFLDDSHGWLATDRGGLLSTTDGGRTWRSIPSYYGERFPQTVRFLSKEHGYLVDQAIGGRFVVLETRDSGLTWTQVYPDLAPVQDRLTFVDAWHGFGLGTSLDGGAILATDDGGATWRQVSTFGEDRESVQALTFADSRNGWVLTQAWTDSDTRYTLYRTSDGGKTWAKLPTDPGKLMDFPLFLSFVDDQTGYVASSYGHLAVTHDGGHSFTVVDSRDSHISDLDFVTQDVGWRVSDFQIYATHDGGRSWSPVPLGFRVFGIQLVSETKAWVEAADCSVGGESGCAQVILSTDDGGRTWTRYDFGSVQVSSLTFADGQHGWFETQDGTLLTTSDGGGSWSPVR